MGLGLGKKEEPMLGTAGNTHPSRALLSLAVAALIACVLGLAASGARADAAIDSAPTADVSDARIPPTDAPIDRTSTKAIGSVPTGTTLHWYVSIAAVWRSGSLESMGGSG